MKSIVIIPARGGSKRIPSKNIKFFLGKPIIAYSIEAALESGIFDEVMVSTESGEIAEIARHYGASVPFMRSSETAGDFATTADVMIEVLDKYRQMGKEFDTFSCVYSTAPFVTAEKLRGAYKVFTESGADNLISVTGFSFPPQRGLVMDENGVYVNFLYPEHANTRSQDLTPMYHDCGQFYFANVKSYYVNRSFVIGKSVPYILPGTEVQDIDNEEDWVMAEIKYRVMLEKSIKKAQNNNNICKKCERKG